MEIDETKKHGGIHKNYSEEMDYFNQGKIYSIQIEVNHSCDQGCLYCYATPTDTSSYKNMPKKDIFNIIDSASKLNVKSIDWLGGDPLVRNDWVELLKYSNEKGLTNNIWTSGIPLSNADNACKAVELTKNGFISVHLDTLDENIYSQLHSGNPKTKIRSILKGVENVQMQGKDPNQMINCITFTKPLVNDVEKTIRYFFEKKGMRTCLTQMCPEGLARVKQYLIPTKREIKDACIIRDKINYPNSKLSFATMDVNKYYCGSTVCVTVDGDVTPCSVIRKSYGNIYASSLEDIIKKNQRDLLFLSLREKKDLPGNCGSCENYSVCWGCRAVAFINSGSVNGPDPNCYKNDLK